MISVCFSKCPKKSSNKVPFWPPHGQCRNKLYVFFFCKISNLLEFGLMMEKLLQSGKFLETVLNNHARPNISELKKIQKLVSNSTTRGPNLDCITTLYHKHPCKALGKRTFHLQACVLAAVEGLLRIPQQLVTDANGCVTTLSVSL